MSLSPDLDDLVARARLVEVRADVASARVAELDRWARAAADRRWPWWSFGGGLALAALAAGVIAWWRWPAGGPVDPPPISIGDRVALIVEPGTSYRVAAADRTHTEILVERGAVTARLWPGAAHRLALRGGGVVAMATGTVYTLAVDPAGAAVVVHEGTVDVREPAGRHAVVAGSGWSSRSDRRMPGAAAARTLLALAAPAPIADEPDDPAMLLRDAGAGPDAATGDDASPGTVDAVVSHPSKPPSVDARDGRAPAVASPSLVERWRIARLLRAQNKLGEALAECLALVEAHDPTWSPIALVEAIRIELGPRASPERAIELADQMAREWPSHGLATEARELRCRALRQLGRGEDCAPPSP